MSNSVKTKGIIWLVVMFASQSLLIIKPSAIGFIDGIIFSFAYKSSLGEGYSQFSSALQLYFFAFVVSIFFFEKNKTKLFIGLIALNILKWLIDIFLSQKVFESVYKIEIKLWVIILFITSAFYVFNIFIKNNEAKIDLPHKQNEESNENP